VVFAGYISNSDRFHSDTAGEERENRMGRIQRQKEIDSLKREQVSSVAVLSMAVDGTSILARLVSSA
jgi:hypothetical protein